MPTSNYLLQVVDKNSNTEWQTVQVKISWLLKREYREGYIQDKVKVTIYLQNKNKPFCKAAKEFSAESPVPAYKSDNHTKMAYCMKKCQ